MYITETLRTRILTETLRICICFPATTDVEDRRLMTLELRQSRLLSSQIVSTSSPLGRLDLKGVGRRQASALPWYGFPTIRRQLQQPRPTATPTLLATYHAL
jgi:hypothetical protein